ncbi:hypothetical protein BZG36_00427 [Bifiguratus adelaidae]|uniref:Ammonia transport outward protein 2 n=1 Tax=Bifiguratus adelaidae TaxID=1938954 RepID=A0A261Y7M6_9FUNG|nr:hypothetical protein BZG36_00427 [Bifiguratus adelaidae]
MATNPTGTDSYNNANAENAMFARNNGGELPADYETKMVSSNAAAAPTGPIIANPGPLGLMAFATTTLCLSLFNAGAGVPASTPPNMVMGMAVFYGGLSQLLAGMWEFKTGNTFGATAFTSYGAFWMAFAAIYVPWFGILPAYASVPASTLETAVGHFLVVWTIVTGIFTIASHRSSIALFSLFFCLFITFILLTASKYNSANSTTTQVAGGAFGIITAAIAYYNALAGLLTPENSFFQLPLGPLNRRR